MNNEPSWLHQVRHDYGVEGPIQLIKLPEGRSHSHFRLRSEHVDYFIKVLNPYYLTLWGPEQFRLGEALAQFWHDQGVPTVYAIQNKTRHPSNGLPILVYPWLDGELHSPDQLPIQDTHKIAYYLDRLHEIQPVDFSGINNLHRPAWPNLQYVEIQDTHRLRSLSAFQALQPLFESLDKNQTAFQDLLNQNLCLSHRDLNPQNILWKNKCPYFIDWERVGWVNKNVDMMDVALNWSMDEHFKINEDRFRVFGKRPDDKLFCTLVVTQWLVWVEECCVRGLFSEAKYSLDVISALYDQGMLIY